MPVIPPADTPSSGARRFHLTRRHLLGSAAILLLSSALSVAAPASAEVSYVDSPDTIVALGLPASPGALEWPPAPQEGMLISVPYVSQLDGSPRASSNCGPAALKMLFARSGDGTAIADIRWSVNQYMGDWSVDNGSSWEALANAARTRGYQVGGLFAANGKYRRWTVDDLVDEIWLGNPVMILVRYRALPGCEASYYLGDHYVDIVGVDTDGSIVYNDPAYTSGASRACRRMTREQLEGAWSTASSGIDYSGMVVGPKTS